MKKLSRMQKISWVRHGLVEKVADLLAAMGYEVETSEVGLAVGKRGHQEDENAFAAEVVEAARKALAEMGIQSEPTAMSTDFHNHVAWVRLALGGGFADEVCKRVKEWK